MISISKLLWYIARGKYVMLKENKQLQGGFTLGCIVTSSLIIFFITHPCCIFSPYISAENISDLIINTKQNK